jgi:hypothetical protein
MMRKKITHGKLREVLQHLGYAEDAPAKGPVVLHKPGTRLPIILPRLRRNAVVEPIHLLHVRQVLANDGVVPEDQFDALFEIRKGDQLVWTEPTTGQQVRVTAAADEGYGEVIIQQNGTLSACPVEQLQKVGLVGAEDAADGE